MLYNTVYNNAIDEKMSAAIYSKDEVFFRSEIIRLSKILAARGNPKVGYDEVATRLLLCLTFNDQIVNNGETAKLLSDMVNF